MAGGSAPGASLVARTLDVLGAFDDRHRRLALADLARRAGLSAPTTLRIARQLVAGGALVREDDGAYVVGRLMWDLGLLAPLQTRLRDVAAPFLADLLAATRATVHLAVRDGDAALYLDRLSGVASVPVVSRMGTRLPLHATGVGKVLLAHAPAEVREAVLADLAPVTPYTVISPRRLDGQLARVVRDGYATTVEEMTLGACSLAVPVRAGDEVVAALGLVVADFRHHRARLLAALQVAAAGVGRGLSAT
ncbi:IclR family transcriptional regulator [Nocardioides sp. T2.26MG-1]|uniref:IclR family transcriptional regulator n=1 Tax=Nocardioides sp. T2.26MG-1 TaxID=3041166 RepID=UPI002477B1A2|nr:IclR family transcriptional regulator [Nocardioides sp. T2.26MG-1]CAI9407713.1 HTH-type transcriptional regulator XynR [Nocardioides sp. T2.26MG-1]